MSTVDFVVQQPKGEARRRRIRRKLIVFSVTAILIGFIGYRAFIPHPRYAVIRLPRQDEQVSLERFHWNGAERARSIATTTTCFTRDTRLTTDVDSITSGKPHPVAHLVTGRNSTLSRPTDPYLMTFPVTFALADARTDDGHTTLITMRGASRAYGGSGGTYEKFDVRTARTLTGRINPGESRLLYVEGDREFSATADMTIADFAASNADGRFLVVTLKFTR